MIKDLNPKIILLQEIKIWDSKLSSIKKTLWGEVDFITVHFEDKSGGILYLWDSSKFNGQVIISSLNFFSILFSFIISLEIFIVTNIYAPTTCVGRRVI